MSFAHSGICVICLMIVLTTTLQYRRTPVKSLGKTALPLENLFQSPGRLIHHSTHGCVMPLQLTLPAQYKSVGLGGGHAPPPMPHASSPQSPNHHRQQ